MEIDGLRPFLEGFGDDLDFAQYLDDPTPLTPAAQLMKTAGQTCYASFGPARTYNENAKRYFGNLVVLRTRFGVRARVVLVPALRDLAVEHARDRPAPGRDGVLAAEPAVRVRARCCASSSVRSTSTTRRCTSSFEERIDRARTEYEDVADELLSLQSDGDQLLAAEAKTDRRKRVQQTARSVLPNEAETILVLTANVRSWRHMIEMRTDQHAESEIRDLFFRIFLCLRIAEPLLFEDYAIEALPDGTHGARTDWRKV